MLISFEIILSLIDYFSYASYSLPTKIMPTFLSHMRAFARVDTALAVSAIFIKTQLTFKVNSLKIRYNAILISF